MPIYEYACKKCGDFEVMQRITEEPLKKCPTCGAKVTKLISHSAFHLKGSGWYMTDYAKNGSSSANGNKTEETKSSSSETKDNKPTSESSSSTAKQASAAA
ncbi:MAG TPA: zinc ribbon domain-containing protein [Methylomirabilota bacterium]|jgi:putative FmdB family regulatory protein|nr:zinc ribbon domain-containing protein [Methylomirabilota bacterium]